MRVSKAHHGPGTARPVQKAAFGMNISLDPLSDFGLDVFAHGFDGLAVMPSKSFAIPPQIQARGSKVTVSEGGPSRFCEEYLQRWVCSMSLRAVPEELHALWPSCSVVLASDLTLAIVDMVWGGKGMVSCKRPLMAESRLLRLRPRCTIHCANMMIMPTMPPSVPSGGRPTPMPGDPCPSENTQNCGFRLRAFNEKQSGNRWSADREKEPSRACARLIEEAVDEPRLGSLGVATFRVGAHRLMTLGFVA